MCASAAIGRFPQSLTVGPIDQSTSCRNLARWAALCRHARCLQIVWRPLTSWITPAYGFGTLTAHAPPSVWDGQTKIFKNRRAVHRALPIHTARDRPCHRADPLQRKMNDQSSGRSTGVWNLIDIGNTIAVHAKDFPHCSPSVAFDPGRYSWTKPHRTCSYSRLT
jgi:hypothetical protein